MVSNVNPETGVRYGVIAISSLKPELAEELMYGPDSIDEDYEAAYADAESRAEKEVQGLFEEAEIAASEVDPSMSERDRERFVEQYIGEVYLAMGVIDSDDFVAQRLEEFADLYVGERPTISGSYEGVDYRIGWPSGVPHLWVLKGPEGGARALYDDRIRDAADLDSGFDVGVTLGHACYVVPKSWLATPTA